MITIPFIYFGILLLFQYKRNGRKMDIACYILLIYFISAFFSILIDLFDLYSRELGGYRVSGNATFVYCGLLTLCVLPFALFSSNKIIEIKKIKNTSFLKSLAWVTFFYFVIYLCNYIQNIYVVK